MMSSIPQPSTSPKAHAVTLGPRRSATIRKSPQRRTQFLRTHSLTSRGAADSATHGRAGMAGAAAPNPGVWEASGPARGWQLADTRMQLVTKEKYHRAAFRFVPYKDKKKVAADLRKIYTAVDRDHA